MLGNFQSRFNTVAKLNNFSHTMSEIEGLATDLAAVRTVLEYEAFKGECAANVSYLRSIEPLPISDSLKSKIESAKSDFRQIRDTITDGKFGDTAAMETNELLTAAKDAYIGVYFEEHKKRRLNVKDGKQKGELISSPKLSNLKRLAGIEILPETKLTAIENDLAALKICYELTSELLKSSHFCPKCGFQLGGSDPLVKGAVERIDDRLDALTAEWTNTLFNSISDPLIEGGKTYLSSEQQSIIANFLEAQSLPDKVDVYFVNAISALLKGFDAVTVSGEELIDKLGSLGPCDEDTFVAKVKEIIDGKAKGKDKSKLRIVIRG
jgi:hypothetical protein